MARLIRALATVALFSGAAGVGVAGRGTKAEREE